MPDKRRNILLILTVFVFACNPSEENKQSDEVKTTEKIPASKSLPDTVYYENGNPQTITIGNPEGSGSKIYEYYHNGQLKQVSEQGTFQGCGIQVGEELNYDSLGNLTSKSSFNHHLPKDASGCHNTHTIVTTEIYYTSGKINLRKKTEAFYESESCNCGTWEYYDEAGTLTKKEKHESCEDAKLDCLQ